MLEKIFENHEKNCKRLQILILRWHGSSFSKNQFNISSAENLQIAALNCGKNPLEAHWQRTFVFTYFTVQITRHYSIIIHSYRLAVDI